MILSAIVAKSKNNVIGKGNDLPWRIPEDMQWFRKSTMGKPVIMGRKTWLSLPKLLPGRQNIIITRDSSLRVDGADVANSLSEALKLTDTGTKEAMIIGGAEIYKLALNQLNRLYLTEIHHEFDGDTYFPDIITSEWNETFREDHMHNDSSELGYSFLILDRQ
jgi:dihydrofolate reductase